MIVERLNIKENSHKSDHNQILRLFKAKYTEDTRKIDWNDFFRSYFSYLGLVLLSLPIIFLIGGNPERISGGISESPYLQKLLLGVFIGPLIEECTSRLWLKHSNLNLIVSLIVLVGGIIYKTFFAHNMSQYFIIEFSIIAVVILICLFWPDFHRKNYKYLLYFSCLIFGLMHITNFANFENIELYKYPILTIPQIILGFVIAYIRMNYGFKYGLLFHSSVNFPFMLLRF